MRSCHRYGILARAVSSPHPEEVEAAGAEPAQSHLLYVEQAQDRLHEAEEGYIDIDFNFLQTCTRERRKRGMQSQRCAGTMLNSVSEVKIGKQRSKVVRFVMSPTLCWM